MYYGSFNLLLILSAQNVISSNLYDPPSSNAETFRALTKEAKNIVVITGAGISNAPAYIQAWGLWRNYEPFDLDSLYTFQNLPFLVWEFTHYRREVILKTAPSPAQKALADYERFIQEEGKGRNLTIITQNIDGLHLQAGSKKVIELMGSVFKTQCVKCGEIRENRNQPIWPSLAGKGHPEAHDYQQVEEEAIPHCIKPSCGGLLRPYLVTEVDDIAKDALYDAEDATRAADLCLIIGTSSTIEHVKEYAPRIAGRGVPVAEFNLINTDFTMFFQYQFKGNCSETLPPILKP